jgi:short-subunit dehydrogenase
MHKFKSGDTALITGASSGIGEEFALQLGDLGLNLILIARRIELLRKLKSKIEAKNNVEVKIYQADLATVNWSDSIPEITKIEVDLLINNAGTGYPDEFGSMNIDEDKKMIQLNCITPLELTHLFLPKMKRNEYGGIIYVSSTMGMQGIPYMAQYSATKGYLLNLGESLYTECKKYNVSVEVLLPGATKTPGINLYDIEYEKLPIKWMDPVNVVKISLHNLGKKALVIPGKLNKFSASISTCACTRKEIQKLMNHFAKRIIKKASNKS